MSELIKTAKGHFDYVARNGGKVINRMHEGLMLAREHYFATGDLTLLARGYAVADNIKDQKRVALWIKGFAGPVVKDGELRHSKKRMEKCAAIEADDVTPYYDMNKATTEPKFDLAKLIAAAAKKADKVQAGEVEIKPEHLNLDPKLLEDLKRVMGNHGIAIS